MIPIKNTKNILFVINTKSGNANTDWGTLLKKYLENKPQISFSFCYPKWSNGLQVIQEKMTSERYDIVVAVGGDGTVRTVAKALYGTDIPLGIVAAGSANGLARDLKIPLEYKLALDIILKGNIRKISTLTINDHFCIHLSDLGFNAKVIRHFELSDERGIQSYIKAGLRVLYNYTETKITITANGQVQEIDAVMVVIANATMYGTGFVINPIGNLDDHLFELIIVKPYSILELGRMALNRWQPQQDKITIIQCSQATIESEVPIHFQVDGEYISKTRKVAASINNRRITVLVPNE